MTSRPRASRRRWSTEFKKRVVAEASQPGVSNAEIARRYDLNANLLFNWKKKFCTEAALIPVEVKADLTNGLPKLITPIPDEHSSTSCAPQPGWVEIELPCGIRLRCGSDVSVIRLAEIIIALRSQT